MIDTSREYPKSPIAGVAAIIFSENSVLLVRRGKDPSRGSWGLPGGAVELGETTKEAVIREVMEETGLEIEPIKFITVFDSISRDKNDRVRYHYVLCEYLCRLLGGHLQASSDVQEAMWIRLDELDSFDVKERTRRFIKKVRRVDGILPNANH